MFFSALSITNFNGFICARKCESRSRNRNGFTGVLQTPKLMASINPMVMHLHLMAFAVVVIVCRVRWSDYAKRRYRDCKRESDLLHSVFHG